MPPASPPRPIVCAPGARRLPDRDRLWPRRRRHRWPGRCRHLRRQGPAELQPAHRPCGDGGGGAGLGPVRRRRRGAGPRLLAGTADPRRAHGGGRRHLGPRPRRPRHGGPSRALAPCGAGAADRGRTAHRGALGQPFRPCEPDDGRPCARRSRWPDRCGRRWRGDRGRCRIHHRRLPRRSAGPPAAGRRAARGDREGHRPAARRLHRRGHHRARHARLALCAAGRAAPRRHGARARRGPARLRARRAGRRWPGVEPLSIR